MQIAGPATVKLGADGKDGKAYLLSQNFVLKTCILVVCMVGVLILTLSLTIMDVRVQQRGKWHESTQLRHEQAKEHRRIIVETLRLREVIRHQIVAHEHVQDVKSQVESLVGKYQGDVDALLRPATNADAPAGSQLYDAINTELSDYHQRFFKQVHKIVLTMQKQSGDHAMHSEMRLREVLAEVEREVQTETKQQEQFELTAKREGFDPKEFDDDTMPENRGPKPRPAGGDEEQLLVQELNQFFEQVDLAQKLKISAQDLGHLTQFYKLKVRPIFDDNLIDITAEGRAKRAAVEAEALKFIDDARLPKWEAQATHGSLMTYFHALMDAAACVHHMGELQILKNKWHQRAMSSMEIVAELESIEKKAPPTDHPSALVPEIPVHWLWERSMILPHISSASSNS